MSNWHDLGFPVHYSQSHTSLPVKSLLIFSFLNVLSVIGAYFLLGKRHKTQVQMLTGFMKKNIVRRIALTVCLD